MTDLHVKVIPIVDIDKWQQLKQKVWDNTDVDDGGKEDYNKSWWLNGNE